MPPPSTKELFTITGRQEMVRKYLPHCSATRDGFLNKTGVPMSDFAALDLILEKSNQAFKDALRSNNSAESPLVDPHIQSNNSEELAPYLTKYGDL